MIVSNPEPGELVKTVVELVNAVNSGGGSVSHVSYLHEQADITANTGDGFEIPMETVVGSCEGVTQDEVGGADFTFQPGIYIIYVRAFCTTDDAGKVQLQTGLINSGPPTIYPAGEVAVETTQVVEVTEETAPGDMNIYAFVEAAVTNGFGQLTVTRVS